MYYHSICAYFELSFELMTFFKKNNFSWQNWFTPGNTVMYSIMWLTRPGFT